MKKTILFIALLALIALCLFIFSPKTLSALGFRGHFIQNAMATVSHAIGAKPARSVPFSWLDNRSDQRARYSTTVSGGPQFPQMANDEGMLAELPPIIKRTM